jgi:hypothetical protein
MDVLRGVRNEASGAIDGFTRSADGQAGQFSRMAVDTVKRYPVATTLLGLGLAALALTGSRRAATRPVAPENSLVPADDVPFVRPTERADLTRPKG